MNVKVWSLSSAPPHLSSHVASETESNLGQVPLMCVLSASLGCATIREPCSTLAGPRQKDLSQTHSYPWAAMTNITKCLQPTIISATK